MDHVVFLDSARVALAATRAELENALAMGVADDAGDLATIPDVIYAEELGTHRAYVAARGDRGPGTLHMELLYKALSRNQAGVVAALAKAKEAVHV
jgi:ABC-2 type transport system ATP-binding protein